MHWDYLPLDLALWHSLYLVCVLPHHTLGAAVVCVSNALASSVFVMSIDSIPRWLERGRSAALYNQRSRLFSIGRTTKAPHPTGSISTGTGDPRRVGMDKTNLQA